MPITVAIVEDDARTCEGFAHLVDSSGDCRCVSQHGSAEQAVDELPKIAPDVVLMDLKMPVMDGVEATRRILAARPWIPDQCGCSG